MTRTSIAIVVGAVAIAGIVAFARPGGPPNADIDRFVSDARDGTRRYRDQQAAIDDGFTRIGVEFPAMGEHWVSFARILEDSFAARRPSVLIYVNSDTGPRLAGVAYTRLLDGEAHTPDFPRSAAWHEHNGAVDEESLPLHRGSHFASGPQRTPRLAILHAWIWRENPDGMFATDNWGLPVDRAGLPGNASLRRDALLALSLTSDRDDYLGSLLRIALDLSVSEDSLAAAVVAAHRPAMEAIATGIRASRQVSESQQQRLTDEWSRTWAALARALPERTERLRELRAAMSR